MTIIFDKPWPVKKNMKPDKRKIFLDFDYDDLSELQAWLYLTNQQSLEITAETDMLPETQQFFSIRLHASNKDFDDTGIDVLSQSVTGNLSLCELEQELSCILQKFADKGITVMTKTNNL